MLFVLLFENIADRTQKRYYLAKVETTKDNTMIIGRNTSQSKKIRSADDQKIIKKNKHLILKQMQYNKLILLKIWSN